MDKVNRQSGTKKSMWQIPVQGEFSAITGMAATAFHSQAQQPCVDWVHWNLRIFHCYWRWNDSMDNGCITQNIEPNKSHGKQKNRYDESKAVCKLAEVQLESETEVHTAGSPKSRLWKSLYVCHWLQWYFKILDFPAKLMFRFFSLSEFFTPIAKLVVTYRKPAEKAGKALQIFNHSALDYNLWTSRHCRYWDFLSD